MGCGWRVSVDLSLGEKIRDYTLQKRMNNKMNAIMLEILPFARKGYCCSQLLMLLLMRGFERQNPDLVRAMHGLCFGMGGSEGSCGLLTGGACVLGCVAGRGKDEESAHPSFVPLISDYQQWFADRMRNYGGTACFQIMQGISEANGATRPKAGEQPNLALCGDLFAECWEKILSLLETYEVPLELR